MSEVLTVQEAERLVTILLPTIARIERHIDDEPWATRVYAADRERVQSDLAGLRQHGESLRSPGFCERCDRRLQPCPDARRYSDGLRRTAALYGVS